MANIGDAAFSDGERLVREVAELRGLVRELVAGRRLENATVGAGGMRVRGTGGITLQEGGDLTVEDGGGVRIRGDGVLDMADEDGTLVVYMGADSSGKQVFQLRREGGSLMFFTAGSAQWGRDFWSWTDSTGQGLIADDAETGIGLARPWLPVAMYPKWHFSNGTGDPFSYMSIDAAKVTAETVIWAGFASIEHPWIQCNGVWGNAGSNTPTFRLRVDDIEVGQWSPDVPLSFTTERFDVSDWVLSDWVPVNITVQASGTGAVACQLGGLYLI